MTNEMLQTNDTNTSVPVAVRLLVAMEMSLKTWRLVMAPEGGTRKRVKAVEAGNFLELEKAVAEARERFKLPPETPVVFCYEAGRDGFYPYRRLTEEGHEVWLIDSASIEVSRRRKPAKSAGMDGDKLAELMQRKARGEHKALRVVRVPSPEAEDERRLPRERGIILHDLGRLRNQVESVLCTQGYRDIPNTAAGLKTWVAERRELAPQLRERLEREIARRARLETQLHAVEKAMAQQAKQEQSAGIAAVAGALMQLCGIGLVGAWVLASEIFGWRQFRNRREVGAVWGLTPTPYSSGQDEREQGISKAGNRRARSMRVELSWLWLRYQLGSALTQWFKTRFGGGGKRMRRIGIVALARRLAIALWRYAAFGVVPEGATLKPAAKA